MNRRIPLALLLTQAALGNALAADFTASLEWSQRVTLSTPVSGVVEVVAVQAGQTVRKEETLLRLNPTYFKAGVMEAKAEVERLTEDEADARRDLERVQELYARTVSATTELDAAKLRHTRAASQLAAAQARLEQARRRLEESELRAPFDAVILSRQAEPGMAVAAQCQPPALITLARADEILARAEVGPEQAANVPLGHSALVTVAGRSYSGKVRAVSHTEARYIMEVAFPRPAHLVAGYKASIRLP